MSSPRLDVVGRDREWELVEVKRDFFALQSLLYSFLSPLRRDLIADIMKLTE